MMMEEEQRDELWGCEQCCASLHFFLQKVPLEKLGRDTFAGNGDSTVNIGVRKKLKYSGI